LESRLRGGRFRPCWHTLARAVSTGAFAGLAAASLDSGRAADLQAGTGVAQFAFDTPTSIPRAGFSKVTVDDAFTSEKRFGFESVQGLLALDRGGSEIVRPRDEYTARAYGAYRTTSDLTCAFIEGTAGNAFIMAVPDGEWKEIRAESTTPPVEWTAVEREKGYVVFSADYTQPIFYPIDEPGNNKTKNRMRFAENVLDFVHQVPGCQTATTVGSSDIQRLGDRVDVRIYAYGSYSRAKVLQEAQQGHPFWFYENGMFDGHSTMASRGLAGFELLRSGAEVATAWGVDCTTANPYNDFDGGHRDWNVMFPGVDGPTPAIHWELCREGVDDCRYVATLSHGMSRRARPEARSGSNCKGMGCRQTLADCLKVAKTHQ
jgi:hypothetical protein